VQRLVEKLSHRIQLSSYGLFANSWYFPMKWVDDAKVSISD